MTDKVTASYSEKVQVSISDAFTSNVAKIIDLEREINVEIDRLIRLRERITKEIDNMPSNIYSALLSSRYLEGKTWEDVAEMLHYDERQIFRIHENALKEFRRINKTCQ